jgi:hypothetical protein
MKLGWAERKRERVKDLKRKGVVLLALIGLLALSGLAFAQPVETEEREDTVFNYGYDDDFHVLLWNTSADDGLYDCTLQNGELTATYGEGTDSVIPVDDLTDGTDVVSFEDRAQEDLAEGLTAAGEPVDYSGADGECGLSGAEVSGPQGQINHGMFMKLFNSLYEGKGRGCLNRYLAQSDLGKGDQQIKVSDVDEAFESAVAGDEGTVEFVTVAADCEHGKKGNGHGQSSAEHGGKPESPGKSGSAPGRNK